ncbi:MAG: hypothetical protein QOE92_2302 [Chloroflexota bacterium]|nr:hypothetical protein [Chloroflexota bacterium]
MLAFCVATGAVLIGACVTTTFSRGWLSLVPAAGLWVLGVRWILEYRGRAANPAWDLFEGAVILAAGVATQPIDILLLAYARLAARSLATTGWHAVWLAVVYAAAFIGSIVVGISVSSVAIPIENLLFLASGFPLVAPLMYTLGSSLRKEGEMAGRIQGLENDAALSAVVKHASDVILVVDADGAIHYASPSLDRLRGSGPPYANVADLAHPDDVIALRSALVGATLLGRAARVQFRLVADGVGWRFVEAVISRLSEDDEAISLVVTARDVTDQRLAEETLRQSVANFRVLFEYNPQPMWVLDATSGEFMEVNNAATRHYGYSRERFLEMRLADLQAATDGADVNRSSSQEHRAEDGREISVEVATHELDFGGKKALLMLVQDVTERRELDARLLHQAFHDTLTGLANRALFQDRVDQAVKRQAREVDPFAVLFIDLDNFKAINDSVGHNAGDAVLVEVAQRLRGSVRPSDTAARLGGDEFGVLVELGGAESAALKVAQRVADSLAAPIEAEGETWFISGSIGIAFSNPDGNSTDAIMRSADVAMYDAKRRGRGQFAVFEPAMHRSVIERIAMEADLRLALERHELTVAYQPQVDLRHLTITGVEALARWHHPKRGNVSPAEFIGLAEDAGIVGELDAFVLQEAAAQMAQWRTQGIGALTLAVNISGKDFSEEQLSRRIADTVAAAGLSPDDVEIEVTESVAFETANARSALADLRARGFRVAIDDFGVGFSMLSRLQDLPVDRLKIDRSFIERITFGEDEAPIVSGIIAMAHSLRLKVVAEGIETSEQLTFLRRSGCDFAQGYRLGRPLPAAEIEALLRAGRLEHI